MIRRLQNDGHHVEIHGAFNAQVCAEADVVWTEWCDQSAYEAADSGVCRKLVLRMRGYEVWGPLRDMLWENVDALVYESPFLRVLAEEAHAELRDFRTHVICGGVEIGTIPFLAPGHGRTIAMVGRTTSDKGYQLAFEWARNRPEYTLHVACALGSTNPRFARYLQHAAPANVVLQGEVDTIPWLEQIQPNYFLSASIWESFGYTIAEAMAMGIMPLVHDAPGITVSWPMLMTWRSFADLDALLGRSYDADTYRSFVATNYSEAEGTNRFIEVLNAPPLRVQPDTPVSSASALLREVQRVLTSADIPGAAIAAPVERARAALTAHGPDADLRYALALNVAAAFYTRDDLAHAEQWACRALAEHPRPDAFALLGEIAHARGELDEAIRWYRVACHADDGPGECALPLLAGRTSTRLAELTALHR